MRMGPTDADALASLADIDVPAPPEWRPVLLVLVALVIATTVIFCTHYARRRTQRRSKRGEPSSREEALTRLEALQRAWQAGDIDDREAGYRLCTLLRLGLRLPQLRAVPPPHIPESSHWQRFVEDLERLRYTPPGQGMTLETFARARTWLDKPPRSEDVAGHA